MFASTKIVCVGVLMALVLLCVGHARRINRKRTAFATRHGWNKSLVMSETPSQVYKADRVVAILDNGRKKAQENCEIQEEPSFFRPMYLTIPSMWASGFLGEMGEPERVRTGSGNVNLYKKVFIPDGSKKSGRTIFVTSIEHRNVDRIEIYFSCYGGERPHPTTWELKIQSADSKKNIGNTILYLELFRFLRSNGLQDLEQDVQQISESDDHLFKILVYASRISFEAGKLIPDPGPRKAIVRALVTEKYSDLSFVMICDLVKAFGIGRSIDLQDPEQAVQLLNQVVGEGSFRKFIDNLTSTARVDPRRSVPTLGHTRMHLLKAAKAVRHEDQRISGCRAVVKAVTAANDQLLGEVALPEDEAAALAPLVEDMAID